MTDGIPTGEQYMAGRRETIAELMAAMQSDDYDRRDEAQQELDELPLSAEVVKHVEILLGTGGPHDELDVTLRNGAVDSVAYHYYWGGERFETRIYSGDALYSYAEYVAEYYADQD